MDQILPVDLLCVWPQHTDFPLWREYIRRDRDKFAKVIIAFTDMNVLPDNRQFIKDAMVKDRIHFVESDKSKAGRDWRSVAVNKALELSTAPWVWFTEQDFIITNPVFWDQTWKKIQKDNLESFIYVEGERPHPASWFVMRDLIEETSRDFGVIKDVSDHFSVFFRELCGLDTKIGYLKPNSTFYHLNGLSQNMYLLQSGQEPNFKIPEFKNYLQQCLMCSIPLLPSFKEMVEKYVSS